MPAQACMIVERKLAAQAEQERRFKEEGIDSGSQLRKLGLLRLETSRLRCGRLVNEPLVEGLRRATQVRVLEVEAVGGAVLESLPPFVERLYIAGSSQALPLTLPGTRRTSFAPLSSSQICSVERSVQALSKAVSARYYRERFGSSGCAGSRWFMTSGQGRKGGNVPTRGMRRC